MQVRYDCPRCDAAMNFNLDTEGGLLIELAGPSDCPKCGFAVDEDEVYEAALDEGGAYDEDDDDDAAA